MKNQKNEKDQSSKKLPMSENLVTPPDVLSGNSLNRLGFGIQPQEISEEEKHMLEMLVKKVYDDNVISNFANLKATENPVGELIYLDYVYHDKNGIETTPPKPKKVKAKKPSKKKLMKDIKASLTNPFGLGIVSESEETGYFGLKPRRQFFSLETYIASATVTREQIQDLHSQFGIDVLAMVENSLITEAKQQLIKQVLGRIDEIGESNYLATFTKCDKFKAWLWKIFKKKYQKTVDIEKDPRKLVAKILGYANQIAVDGRVGPATAVIVGTRLATILQDSAAFVYANIPKPGENIIYKIGSIRGLNIFVNASLTWMDNSVTVMRKGSPEQYGIHVPYHKHGAAVSVISEATMAPKIIFKSRHAVIATPGTKNLIKKFYVKNINV